MRYSADDHLADLEALLGSATPDELHRALVLGVPAFSRHEVSWPVRLLREVHKAEPEHVGESVVLLATDPRWKSARGLMPALAESGVVADEVLDVVATAFVQAGEFVWWRCLGDWFGHGVAVELDDGGAVDVAASSVGDDEDSESTVVRRRVSIDARRWAVHRLLTGCCVERRGGAPRRATTPRRPRPGDGGDARRC